jgi:glycerol-3-phosphate acyltransferase PlsY
MAGFAFTIIAFCILGYLVGNVLFAQVLAHSFYNKNLRAEGSFNPGATNLVRTTKNR